MKGLSASFSDACLNKLTFITDLVCTEELIQETGFLSQCWFLKEGERETGKPKALRLKDCITAHIFSCYFSTYSITSCTVLNESTFSDLLSCAQLVRQYEKYRVTHQHSNMPKLFQRLIEFLINLKLVKLNVTFLVYYFHISAIKKYWNQFRHQGYLNWSHNLELFALISCWW